MRRTVRQLIIAAAATATLVTFAAPVSAALSVQALWNMDALPTLVDNAGGDNNGTAWNITLSGGAYSFNGTSSYAMAPDQANLNPGAADIRLSARVSITQVPQSGQTFDIVRKGAASMAGGYYKMEITRSALGAAIATCLFKDANGRSGDTFGTVNLANQGFVDIICIKTPTGVTLTAAGETVNAAKTLESISNSAPIFIGQKGDETDWFPGLMDYVSIEVG